MSNGSRLIAVIVVVVLAAIGLYFAFLYDNTAAPGAGEQRDMLAPQPASGEVILAPGAASGSAAGTTATATGATPSVSGGAPMRTPPTAPPAGAFAPPSGAAAQVPPMAGQPSSNPTTGGSPVPVGVTPPAGTGSTPPAPPRTEYTIRAEDTLEGLARRFLGDAAKWRLIADANPGLNPTRLKIGQKIIIPGTATAGASGSPATPTSGTPTAGSPAAGANTYTVLKGDTLIGIARKVYGVESDWRKILDANSALLRGDASALQPGMKLVIPAKN